LIAPELPQSHPMYSSRNCQAWLGKTPTL
jgi:hypothetical protein